VSGNLKSEIVVLGLGNPLMTDEGIGVALIEQLSAIAEQFPNVDFIDAGTGGISLLYLIEGRRKAILLDCSYMETAPGTMKKFEPTEAQSVKKLAHQSLHEVDILKVLDLSKQLGQLPEKVVIFGIEPETIELGQALTETLSAKMDQYIAEIKKELAE